MIEEIFISYLNDVLDVPVYAEKPTELTKPCVIIERTSGGKVNHIKNATFAIQSYSISMLEAAKLNELVKTAMDNSATLPEIASAVLNSDFNSTYTEMKLYRYTCVYDITHY